MRIFPLMDDLVCNFLESGELVLNFMGDAVDGIGIVGQPFEVGFVFMKNRLDRHFKQMRFRLTHKKNHLPSGSISRIKEIASLVHGD